MGSYWKYHRLGSPEHVERLHLRRPKGQCWEHYIVFSSERTKLMAKNEGQNPRRSETAETLL